MADNNTSNNTYKYIDTDIDRDLLIRNLQHNAQSYAKYKGWDESKAREFYNALDVFKTAMEEGRLSSDYSGSIIDSKGELDNGKANWRDKTGTVYNEGAYNALSDRQKRRKGLAQDFYANREVASYIGEVAKKIYDKTQEEEKKKAEEEKKKAEEEKKKAEEAEKNKPAPKKFNLKDNGVWSNFLLDIAPTGSVDLESWLALDAYDPATKKRGTTNRAGALAKFITRYKDSLDQDLDFSESSFGTRDAYTEKLNTLSNALKDGIDESDYRLLSQLGGDPEQYRALFTTAEKYDSKTGQNTGGDSGDSERTKQLNDLASSYVRKYDSKKYQKYTLRAAPTGVKYNTTAKDKVAAYRNALNANKINFSVSALQATTGKNYVHYLEQYGEMNPKAVRRVTDGKYSGWYYIPESLNEDDFSVLSYNPKTHSVARLYYGTLGSEAWEEYRKKLENINSSQAQRKPAAPFQQQGGTVKTTRQQQPASPNNAKKGSNHSSNELTATDKARLAVIAADIAALVDPEPISSLALGVGSDITNFVADLKDDKGVKNSLGNLAGNLGLSLVGTIPIFGNVLGSGSKVVKGLVKLAPKIDKLLQSLQTVNDIDDADEIINSFSKIGKDGPENEMDMQDWRNVKRGLQYILIEDNVVSDPTILYGQQGGTVKTTRQQQPASPYGAAELFDQQQKALSQQTKSDPKLRQPWKGDNNYSSNELTATDKARLAAIAADITALVDPEPISAAALGVGSDITNFVADIKEGQGIWNSLGTFAGNLGLSALGVIPVYGDALGSGTKVVKGLVKLAPKINKLLLGTGLLAGVSNADEIIKSFSKIGKDGPENEMNMQDWRNVGLALQYVLGGANAARNARAAKKAQQAKAASATDHIDVRVKDQSSSEEKVLRFGGKNDTEKLKNAKTANEVNMVINSHPSMKDKYKVVTETETSYKTHLFGAGYDQGKWYKPSTWREKIFSDNLAEDAVRTVYDARKFHSNYKVTVGRGQHLNNLVTATKADKSIARDARAKTTKSTTTGSPTAGSPTTGSPTAGSPTTGSPTAGSATTGSTTTGSTAPKSPTTGSTAPKSPTTESTAPKSPTTESTAPKSPTTESTAPKSPTTESPTTKVPKMPDDTLIERARQYRSSLGTSTVGKQHSPEFNELERRGFTSADLREVGLWKQGGKFVVKADGGINTNVLNTTLSPYILPWPRNWRDYLYPSTNSDGQNNSSESGSTSATPTTTNTKNYGNSYTSRSADFYENGEYGTTEKVDLSGIQNADASRRSSTLTTSHGQGDYDYTDAQANTTKARQEWQHEPYNRAEDFVKWAETWWSNNKNKDKTQLDMLADYNKIIDAMYDYRHEMGTAKYSGDKAYRNGKEVLNFNNNNKAVYASANSRGDVNGWDKGQASYNGTTTAQRFIDITNKDVNNIDFKSALNTSIYGDKGFLALFDNLVKDPTGRYYVSTPALQESTLDTDQQSQGSSTAQSSTGQQSGGSSRVDPSGNSDDDHDDTKTGIDLGGILEAITPNAIAVGRYLAARNNNKKLLDIARQMPVMLYDPSERHRWVYGDQAAVQRGRQAAGQLSHLASRAITSDGAQQQAAQMEALMKGQQYIDQGNQQNDKITTATREANWEQEGKNQESRYSTAMKNRANLFQKRTSYLDALGKYHRANYESLNALLGQFEAQAQDKVTENKSYRQAAEQASLRNDIAAHLDKYGIGATGDEQQLINDVLSGKKGNLTDEEQKTYNRISEKIEEKVTEKTAAARGVSYRPFKPSTSTSSWLTLIRKRGGVIEKSEKVMIQEMKGKIEKMKTRQKHLEARMNAFEKDLDRATKSASQYLKGQLKK